MKILVCGGRDPDLEIIEMVFPFLDYVHSMNTITELVHGAAKGIDSLADAWAKDRGVTRLPYPADWNKHGRAAGPIRNSLMLSDNPDIDLVIAFKGNKGTSDMIKKSRKKGIEIIDSRGIEEWF